MWRGATTNKSIKGYSDAVVTNHKRSQPNLPKPGSTSNLKTSASSSRTKLPNA